MISMSILDVLLVFVMFCIVWIISQVAWKIIEGKMLLKRQEELMDSVYSKGVRLILRGVMEFKDIKEVVSRDKM